jgi:hypothetical protein
MDNVKTHSLKVPVAVTFLLMLAINTLSVVLPINGVTPGEVSDSYPNLFAPAGITFAIWGVIYLALAAYTLYQFGMSRKNPDPARSVFAAKVRSYFVISSIANSAWIFAWHYRLIPVAMALITVMRSNFRSFPVQHLFWLDHCCHHRQCHDSAGQHGLGRAGIP